MANYSKLLTQVNAGVKVVAFANTTNPTPRLNINLNTSNNSNGTSVSTVNYAGLRNLRIARQNTNYMCAAVNSASSDNVIFWSTNGGSSWNAHSTTDTYLFSTAISDNGQAMFSQRTTNTSQTLYYTYNGGSSWSTTTPLASGITARNPTCNWDGSYVAVGSLSHTSIAVSTNSCGSFTTRTTPFTTVEAWMTADGSRIWIGEYNYTTSTRLAYSDNLGVSWTTVTIPYTSGGQNYLKGSADGKHLLVHNSRYTSGAGGEVFVSHDYGVTWATKSVGANTAGSQVSVSKSGQYMCLIEYNNGGLYGKLRISKDYGETWSQFTISSSESTYYLAAAIEEIHTNDYR